MDKIKNIRNQFPALSRKVYGKDLIYLDSAATSQRVQSVVDLWNKLSLESNGNIHRAVHYLSEEASAVYEGTRDFVKEYLNAASREEIIFTYGTTSAINLLAYSFGEAFINPGDEIIVTEAEHHSNIVPWQLMCKRKGAILKVLPVDENGYLRLEELENLCSEKTKLLAVTHVSNVLGLVNPIKEIVDYCHSRNIPVLVDGAQGIVHLKVDVQALDCDFYTFSGHKIYATTGTGALYGKRKWLEVMPPFMGGGEMVDNVSFEETTYAPLPLKFEAGTQNFTAIPTLKPALEFAETLFDPEVEEHMNSLKQYIYDALNSDKRIKLYGKPLKSLEEKVPLFSFSIEGIHHQDVAMILDKLGIAVRSGQMCAEPLMDVCGVTGMLRVSFAPYNTLEEAKYFIASLNRAIEMLK